MYAAQPPTQPPAQVADSASRAQRVDTVVVRVLRTPLPTLRAPFAVSRVGAEAAQRARAGLAVDEALRGVPGVQVDNRFNAALGERVSIRGFGARTQFGVRGVKVLVDGVPATMPDGQTSLNHVELGTLGGAEVERGPASALYGNAAGGVVLLETAPAPDSALGVTVRAVGGADGLARYQATVGGRGAAGAWLVGGSRVAYDGFRQWSDQRSTRVVARGDAGADTGALGALRLSAAWVDYDAHNPGSLSRALLDQDPSRAFANNVNQKTGEAGRHGQLGLGWRRALPLGAVDVSAWGLGRRLTNPIPVAIVALDRTAGGVRAAWTARLAPARAGLTLGGEAQRQRDDRQNYANAQGAKGALSLDQLERVTAGALFAQADATVGPVVALAGVRHDRVRFAADDRLVTATNPDDSGDRTLSATTPSLGVSVALARAVSVYANVSTSFETPTTTELANRPTGAGGLNPDLDPQRARSLEGGVKGAHALGSRAAASWQLAAYTTRLTHALVPFEVPGAAGRQFYRNAGRARHRGVEASGEATVPGNVTLRAAYTLVDARFTDYTVRDTSYAGNRVPGVSPRRLDFSATWRGPRGALVGVDLRAQDRTQANDANRAASPGFATADVRASLGSWRVGGAAVAPFAGVTNALDARYVTAVTVNANGARYYEPGARRAFHLGVDLAAGRAGR